MAELVRVAALTGLFRDDGGVRAAIPCRCCVKSVCRASMLGNPEQVISARAAMRLLERSAEITGCITLGLRMAEGRRWPTWVRPAC